MRSSRTRGSLQQLGICAHAATRASAGPSPHPRLTHAWCASRPRAVRQPQENPKDPDSTGHKAIKAIMYYLKGLPDGKDMLCGFYVSSINEWKLHQPRYLLLSKTAFYRPLTSPGRSRTTPD